jgi:hypothetical protein
MRIIDNAKNSDVELAIINDTLAQIARSGISITSIWVANFLVALKSKPLILLTGPTESAKETLVNCFSNILTMGNFYQFQTMMGHPWWASHTSDVVTYTRFQSRFNTLKLESIIEEASLPQNKGRYFIAELIKISPGELEEYFSETAFQLQHKELMRLPTSHFSEPIPFPPNLSIVGTIDTINFNRLDRDLLSQATILDCYPVKPISGLPSENFSPNTFNEKSLLHSSIRDPQQAFWKLSKILVRFSSGLLPFLQVKQVLQEFRSVRSDNSIFEGIVYLANSWSYTGEGLFDRDSRINLQIALDLAISQSLLLPQSEKIAKSINLQKRLHKILDSEFPQASTYLNQLNPA